MFCYRNQFDSGAVALRDALAIVSKASGILDEGKHPKYEEKKVQDGTVVAAVDAFLAHLRKKGLLTVTHTEPVLRVRHEPEPFFSDSMMLRKQASTFRRTELFRRFGKS